MSLASAEALCEAGLDAQGWALVDGLMTPDACRAMAGLYPDDARFRSRVVMERHGFGRGEYKYFAYPLPELVRTLRRRSIRAGADRQPLARGDGHRGALSADPRGLPGALPRGRPDRGRRRCCCATGPGDYNCLHQDLYGEHVFPLQVAILLSEPGRDFTGGEFVLTEQRPRMQSRAEVVPLRRAMRWCSRCITGRCRAPAALIGSICAMA